MKAGIRLKSAVCDTEVMVIRAAEGVVACGGKPMAEDKPADGGSPDPEFAAGTLLGKRYIDADDTIELLCVKPGDGSLSLDGVALTTKDAKPLPSSD
ncbi:MAG: hypothetical protein R3228_02610 [Halioglobus sp.]|nr:hypothetical protein [Halioglobus sp.]